MILDYKIHSKDINYTDDSITNIQWNKNKTFNCNGNFQLHKKIIET